MGLPAGAFARLIGHRPLYRVRTPVSGRTAGASDGGAMRTCIAGQKAGRGFAQKIAAQCRTAGKGEQNTRYGQAGLGETPARSIDGWRLFGGVLI